MKTSAQHIFSKLIFTTCCIVCLQSCSRHENGTTETFSSVKSTTTPSPASISTEELEQAAALLILAAAASETDQDVYSNENDNQEYHSEDERQKSIIKDVVETNLSSNIVYE